MPSSRAKSLAIIGAGRVGRALGKLLRERGWRIGGVLTRSGASARAAIKAIGGGRPLRDFAPVLFDADVLLICTPDDAIAPVARELASRGDGLWRGKVVLHTSGALDSRELTPLAILGAAVGSMHPFQSFGARGIPDLRGVTFTVEGHPRAVRVAKRIARQLGGVPIQIPARAKPAYHAAGGFAAAHVLALMEGGAQMLSALGFPKKQAQRGLLRMARQVLDNLEALGPRAAWSGPVSRGDLRTVAKHMEALRKFPPEFRTAHAALLLLSARTLAAERGATLRRLKQILKD
ncbi:MAG TPA: DUF2520 domain-containing protein [Candidatus Acidoferrales bacterium]|jgi:predicted short-subunit dehydrogenase-like oxidoreductase (DUF2520 family)|nr:DUF2520 domain-containing protein [Candidatus Acidoferrales bacterium]